jgi:hypothetical protein
LTKEEKYENAGRLLFGIGYGDFFGWMGSNG